MVFYKLILLLFLCYKLNYFVGSVLYYYIQNNYDCNKIHCGFILVEYVTIPGVSSWIKYSHCNLFYSSSYKSVVSGE